MSDVWRRLAVGFLLVALAAAPCFAQSAASAALAGRVLDPSGGAVAQASVALLNRATGAYRAAVTDDAGRFRFPSLPPSRYDLEATSAGFETTELHDLVLQVGEERTVQIRLTVGSRQEAVVVEGTGYRDSGAVATVVDRDVVDRQPLNGRSFQTLIELSPGVTIVPTNVTTGGTFSANGQRSGSNAFTVDGVSANFGVAASATLYQTAGGGLPSFSAQGGTNVLASVDAVQEFAIQTSSYAPEFGRQAGGQVSIVTRAGSNAWHGTAFEYFRDDHLDANDFFANGTGQPKAKLRQHDFGGTLGGPILRDRTFFFASYEGLRLTRPVTSSPLVVPSVAARSQGSAAARDILKAFPLPNGPAAPGDPDSGTLVATYTVPSSLDAASVRIDHTLHRGLTLFGRYSRGPSHIRERAYFATPNVTSIRDYLTESVTLGATWTPSPRIVNDLRLGWARARAGDRYEMDDFGGAVVPPLATMLPPFVGPEDGLGIVNLGNSSLNLGLNVVNTQKQVHVVDALTVSTGSHALKLGADVRRMLPHNGGNALVRYYQFDTTADIVSESPAFLYMFSTELLLDPRYTNVGAFAQDTWRPSSKLTLTYGLRYDYNPAPTEAQGNLPLTATGVDSADGPQLAPRGTRYYQASHDLAPRLGFAYDVSRARRVVLRGGAGLFYDLPYAFTGSAFSAGTYPYGNTLFATGITLSSPLMTEPLPPVTVTPPYDRIFAYEDGFRSPRTWQWNLGLEKGLGPADVVTATYVGAAGRRLGRVESLQGVFPDFSRIDLVRSAAGSDYHALQVQYRRRPTRGLAVLASYTLASARDDVSDESIINFQVPAQVLDVSRDRGAADFDVRHAFTAALSYDLPLRGGPGLVRAIAADWSLDALVRARSALPVNVVTGTDPLGLGYYNSVIRPDVVPGMPLYVDDASAPGGRRINAAAFTTPAGRQGGLERNSIRGFGAWQVDLSLHRQIPLGGPVRAHVRADFFNVFNHPNFANPDAAMTSPSFGVATQMLARGLGGLDPLYQIGGPRSIQLSLRLAF